MNVQAQYLLVDLVKSHLKTSHNYTAMRRFERLIIHVTHSFMHDNRFYQARLSL